MPLGCVHLFHSQDGACITRLKAALLRQGLNVWTHRQPTHLCQAISVQAYSGEPGVVLLAGSFEQNSETARLVRKSDALAVVIAIFPSLKNADLQRALCHGIDACWLWSVPAQTAAASVQRFVLNLGASRPSGPAEAEPPAAGWSLVSRAWEVQSPEGRRIPLTTSERALILALRAAPDQRLSHAELASAISTIPGKEIACPDTTGLSGSQTRRFSVMVSRLRKKFLAVGLETPVRTIRGRGYELTVEFESVESADTAVD